MATKNVQKPSQSRQATVADVGEFGLIDLIRRWTPALNKDVVLSIGDDTAALQVSPGRLLLATCDVQVEGRHFRIDCITPYQLGKRSAAINLSDIAAMGGTPRFALVSLGLPPSGKVAWVEEFYRGLAEELGSEGAVVVGGNLSDSERLFVDITLLGEVAPDEMMTRSSAKAGDHILVTGLLGASAAGLLALEHGIPLQGEAKQAVERHLTPRARVKEGRAIARLRRAKRATAMIDISDGLASDLRHICRASGLSAQVRAAQMPIAPSARAVAAALGLDPLELALHGGEDYELLFTAPAPAARDIAAVVERATGTPVRVIGTMVEAQPNPDFSRDRDQMALVLPNGSTRTLEPQGWDHFKKSPAHLSGWREKSVKTGGE